MPRNPLDVLAQQIVAMASMDDWTVADLERTIRRAAPFSGLTRPVLDAVLDMLAGRYPSEDFAGLRPRVIWDRTVGAISGRPGSQRLAISNGGTIPDRGLFGVFLASGQAKGPSRRVGELDEEMVYESRVGDVFVLGATSWRIEDITADQVLVTPAAGQPGRLPFWHGDAPGRPAELGAAIGAFRRELGAMPEARATSLLRAEGLDGLAAANLVSYLTDQRKATGYLPDDKTLVLERFRDELGDWRLVLHSPYGAKVHAPWALAIAARLRERYGAMDVQALHTDDGIVIRVPDADDPPPAGIAMLDPDEVEQLVTAELGSSALFASRFRECAARALLLPRRQPGRRTPLWQQRQRAAQLLAVASQYGTFPVILETVRECLQDVFDVPGLVALMRDLTARTIRLVEVETPTASPFSKSVLFRYIGAFMYEGDAPLAERRAQALALDSALLAELLGQPELRELLDPLVVEEAERELQRLAPGRACKDAEAVADMLRALGPLTADEVAQRSADPAQAPAWLAGLARQRRIIELRVAGEPRWCAIEDSGRLRDALGVALPPGVPDAFTEPVPDPLRDLVLRYARTHGPFSAAAVAARYGLGVAVVTGALHRVAAEGILSEGDFHPSGGTQWCEAGVLRMLRRRCLAKLRKEVEPAPPSAYAAFLPAWQHADKAAAAAPGRPRPARSDAVYEVIDQLAGAAIPASALETLVLPDRVPGYSPALLDELTAAGEVAWSGAGALPGGDGWIVLAPGRRCPPAAPGSARDHADPGARGGHGRARRRRCAVLPGDSRPGRCRSRDGHDRPRCGQRNLGPGLGRAPDQRHARAAAHRARQRPAGGRAFGIRRGRRCAAVPALALGPRPAARLRARGAAVAVGPTDRQRPVVGTAPARGRSDPAPVRAGAGAAGAARHPDPRRGGGRAHRVRHALPGAAGAGGGGPVPSRILRRGPRCGSVRARGRGRPDAGHGRGRAQC